MSLDASHTLVGKRLLEQDVETKDGEYIDQSDYVKNKLTTLNSEVAQLRKSDENDKLSDDNAKKYSTTVGRLIWILPTHPRYSYEISYLSRYRAFPRVKHLRRMAAVVRNMTGAATT